MINDDFKGDYLNPTILNNKKNNTIYYFWKRLSSRQCKDFTRLEKEQVNKLAQEIGASFESVCNYLAWNAHNLKKYILAILSSKSPSKIGNDIHEVPQE